MRIAAVAVDIGLRMGAAGSTAADHRRDLGLMAEPIVVAVHIALVVVVAGSTALDSVHYS